MLLAQPWQLRAGAPWDLKRRDGARTSIVETTVPAKAWQSARAALAVHRA